MTPFLTWLTDWVWRTGKREGREELAGELANVGLSDPELDYVKDAAEYLVALDEGGTVGFVDWLRTRGTNSLNQAFRACWDAALHEFKSVQRKKHCKCAEGRCDACHMVDSIISELSSKRGA